MFEFRRSHDCGTLRKEHCGSRVTLAGWVHRRRDHGGLIFIDLRDRYGITQLVFNPEKHAKEHAEAEKLRCEYVISIQGTVYARASDMINFKIATGYIEVIVEEFEVLSKAKTPPFSICDENINVNEELRLQYRFLDLRRGDITQKLVLRHQATMTVRKFMDSHGFIEIATPILAKSTPEGARDYLVPSRVHSSMFYALPQSPQIFKQLLMVGGIDRYFQIAQCFRDEDLRADRQPEFTQIDMEMSFATPQELFPIVEGLMQAVFKECTGVEIKTPFRKMTHKECIDQYGTDRPDLRFCMPLISLDDIAEKSEFMVFTEVLRAGGIVKGLCVKGGADISRKEIEEYTKFVSGFGINGLAWLKMQDGSLNSNIVKFFPIEQQKKMIQRFNIESGDLLFMIADIKESVNQALDHLRRKIARDQGLLDPNQYEFVWVTDFPLFCWNTDENRLESEHHPFTSPLLEDIPLMDNEPLKVRSSSYDLVLNGSELASGSQRIHNSELQQKIFEVLKLTTEEQEEKFGFFVEALRYGTPPHLGLALGFDRIMMILTQTENIRDVIAFPKTQKASDLMMQCPSEVSKKQLRELNISVRDHMFTQ